MGNQDEPCWPGYVRRHGWTKPTLFFPYFFSHKSEKINIFVRRDEANLTGEFDKFWATFPSPKMFPIRGGVPLTLSHYLLMNPSSKHPDFTVFAESIYFKIWNKTSHNFDPNSQKTWERTVWMWFWTVSSV